MKNKDKYDLTKLTFKIEGENNPSQVFKILDGTNVIFEKPILLNRVSLSLFLSWLEEEYVPEILTEREKTYLSAVIKPFRKDVEWIERMDNSFVNGNQHQFLCISLTNDYCCLPLFKKDTMYKGMEVNNRYSLEELGL